ncbi:MAG: zinc-dependent metalloprotease [Gemmatimonadetes bacterium]|nr:zinc-dependent metalloprotease [Gemmatimonadota bacterium]
MTSIRVGRAAAMTVFVALALGRAPVSAQPGAQTGGEVPTIEDRTASMELMDGFMPLYWEEASGRIWLEIGEWDTDVLHASGIGAGLGSNDIGIDRGQLAGSRVVRFQRVGPKVLMIQPNYRFRASSDNAAERKAVEDAFAPSTLWGFTVGAETGDRVLVDFTPFLLQDIAGLAGRMRPGTYRLDASRSAVYLPMVMNFPENTEMEASLTFVRQDGGGGGFGGFGGGGGGFEGVGNVAASAAAATIRMHHSFIKLPELGEYTPRAHNPRGGYGGLSFQDYSTPLGEPMTKRFIRRHRLEKRDPSAAMSEPVEPLVYYLDPGTPEPVRSALLDGARWWNQAFEAAGFIDAFRVEMRPEDVSSHDVRYNVINWVHRSTRGWSTGGSITDPRTGEILKGTVTLGSLRVRQDYLIAEGLLAPYENGDESADDIAEWALDRIRQLSAHEIGHTLGLSHNYYDSEAGRISVMDYPHPLITLDGHGFDYSEVYDTDIGEWDKVSIRYGYEVFPPGTDEAAELEKILDEAWDEDVRFFTNQDVSAHARADQWSNGTDAGAELDRMLDVRRAALDRFGERAIRTGRPMAQMEEVLVPLYLHHRFQVTAAASVLGGMHYTYAVRGDGLDPVRPASAAEQNRALDALVRALQPAELTIPESVLAELPPRPSGYGRTRELFPRYTGPMFDAISPAVVAAAHVVDDVLNPSRAARLLEQRVLDASLPGLGDVIGALVEVGEPNGGDGPYEAEVRRAVGRVVADGLMRLADGAPMSQVRAVAARHLGQLGSMAAGLASDHGAQGAHFALLARDIQRFENRPFAPWSPVATPNAPPGAPIGSPAMDWIGDWVCDWSEWSHAGGPWTLPGGFGRGLP